MLGLHPVIHVPNYYLLIIVQFFVTVSWPTKVLRACDNLAPAVLEVLLWKTYRTHGLT